MVASVKFMKITKQKDLQKVIFYAVESRVLENENGRTNRKNATFDKDFNPILLNQSAQAKARKKHRLACANPLLERDLQNRLLHRLAYSFF